MHEQRFLIYIKLVKLILRLLTLYHPCVVSFGAVWLGAGEPEKRTAFFGKDHITAGPVPDWRRDCFFDQCGHASYGALLEKALVV